VAVILYLTFGILASWFGLATQVKRWHDLDLSGWMVLVNLTVIAIPFVFLIHGFVRGTRGTNRFGRDPLGHAPEPTTCLACQSPIPANQTACPQCGWSY
jgi:uncharacterized membrane protein YhaH (DUF805 family)